MSIQSEIERLVEAKNDIATSIENKGVTVPSNTLLSGMPSLIDQITGDVTSVNGQTGDVVLSAIDVGALASDATYVQSVNGSSGTVQIAIPSNLSDLNNDSGFITGMTILSYGSSTWNDFIIAYNANKVVYCRASSNSNPASGGKNRLAFMAYVNNESNPTNVEFQYYRSVVTHTDAQQGDQVYVYKLDKTAGWSVTTRETYTKVAANNGLTTSYNNGTITVSHANPAITAQSTQAVYPIAIDAYGHITGYGSAVTIPEIPSVTASDNGKILTVVNGAWAAAELPIYEGSVMDYANSRLW